MSVQKRKRVGKINGMRKREGVGKREIMKTVRD